MAILKPESTQESANLRYGCTVFNGLITSAIKLAIKLTIKLKTKKIIAATTSSILF